MIPAPFEYFAPKTLDETVRLLERHGDEAKLLAGGHSLLPLMKFRLAAPRYVIDIGRLSELKYIREGNGHIAIGALTTHAEIERSDQLSRKCPLLVETAREIGDVQVRHRGTIGGSLAHADPSADYPAAVLALDAEVVCISSSGSRSIPATTFFVDMLTTQLRPGEVLTEVRFPTLPPRTGTAYLKMHQPASGYAVVGVAAKITMNSKGVIEQVAIGVTGVGSKAYRATAAEHVLAGKRSSPKLFADAAKKVAEGIEVLFDIHASAGYRREMACVFTRRVLERAHERASGRGKKSK
jgi:carbon-monoxide dehydrogenase medium subunit